MEQTKENKMGTMPVNKHACNNVTAYGYINDSASAL